MNMILILGGSGLIGKAVINEMTKYNQFYVYSTYFKNPILLNQDKGFKLDIQDEDKISSILYNLKPQIIISCLRGDFKKQIILHIKAAEYLRKNGGGLYFSLLSNRTNKFPK